MFIKVFYRNIHNSKGETIQLCSKSVSRLPVLYFCHTPTYSSWFSCLKSLWNMNTKMGNNCLFPVKLRQSRSWQNNVDTIAIRGLSALSHNLDQQMEVPTCSNLYSSYRVMHKALKELSGVIFGLTDLELSRKQALRKPMLRMPISCLYS